jgi:MFS family permease
MVKKKKSVSSEAELKQKSRNMSIKEGSFSTVRQSLCDSYITPFAVAINSSNVIIGLLTSISGLLGPISQWFSSRLIETHSRKKIVVASLLYESLMWIPMILTAFLFYKGIISSVLPLFLLVLFSLYVMIANIAGPAWFSWVGDLVDDSYRGKWFSKRNFITGVVGIVSTLLAAFFLDYFKREGRIMFGFIILFFLGMSARLIAREYFKRSYEPKLVLEKNYYFSLWEFIKKAPFNNFGRYTLFRAVMNFSVSIAGPFFAVYMLRDLHFSYVTFITVTLAQSFFGLLVMKKWGKFADKYGNFAVMKITLVFISIYPLLWLVPSPPLLYLILGTELVGGIAWAGFNLAGSNFIFDCVTPQRRGIVVSYFNVLSGIGVFLGAGLGAILVGTLDITFMNILLFVFIVSGVARLVGGLLMIPYIKEVRKTKKFNSTDALRNLLPLRRVNNVFEDTYEYLAKKRVNWKK